MFARQPESTTKATSIFAVATSYQHGDVDEYLHPLAREAVRRCAQYLNRPVAIAEWHGLTRA